MFRGQGWGRQNCCWCSVAEVTEVCHRGPSSTPPHSCLAAPTPLLLPPQSFVISVPVGGASAQPPPPPMSVPLYAECTHMSLRTLRWLGSPGDSISQRHSMTSSEEHLSSCTVSLNSDTPSSAGQVGSDCGSTKGSSGTLSHGDSNSTISISSYDTASTASRHDSDIMDDPQNTWENLGLVELETPVWPRRRRRLNTPSTDVSTRSCLNSPRISFSSGCHTPVTDSD